MNQFVPGWSLAYLQSFSLSLVLSLALMPLAIRVFRHYGILDQPNPRKIHHHPIPRMGGVVVYIAFVLPMLLKMHFDRPQQGIILGGGIALLIGMIDDIRGIPAVVKLLCLFLLTLFIRQFGVCVNLPFGGYLSYLAEWTGLPLDYGSLITAKVLNLTITVLWLAGVCSAINAIDHMDGLAGGIAVIAAIAYLGVSIYTSQWFWGLTSICLIGSLLGFLCFNRHPARIFLGDSGSFFLGFSLGAIGIMGGWSPFPLKSAIVPVLILSLPLFDLAYVIVVRRLDGTTKSIRESITYCGKDHLGHRLMNIGLNQVQTARIVYLFAAALAISALTILRSGRLESLLMLIQVILLYIVLLLIMRGIAEAKKRKGGGGSD